MDGVRLPDVSEDKFGMVNNVIVCQIITGMELFVCYVSMAKYGILQAELAIALLDIDGMEISVKSSLSSH